MHPMKFARHEIKIKELNPTMNIIEVRAHRNITNSPHIYKWSDFKQGLSSLYSRRLTTLY